MKYEIKLALQFFTLGTIILIIAFFTTYMYNYKMGLSRELQHTISLVNEVSANFEQQLLEKLKINQTLSIAPVFKRALKKSN